MSQKITQPNAAENGGQRECSCTMRMIEICSAFLNNPYICPVMFVFQAFLSSIENGYCTCDCPWNNACKLAIALYLQSFSTSAQIICHMFRFRWLFVCILVEFCLALIADVRMRVGRSEDGVVVGGELFG